MSESYNPRYLAYCRAKGNTPHQQMFKDRKEWPGGVMCGFILWMGEQWDQFERDHYSATVWGDKAGNFPGRVLSSNDRAVWRVLNSDAFDVWLETKLRDNGR